MTQTSTAAQYLIRQINAERSGCSYTHDRRTMLLAENEINIIRAQWKAEIRATTAWSSDYLIVEPA